MKRMIFALCCAFSLSLCACTPSLSASELMARLITDADDLPGSYLTYYSDAIPDTEHYLDDTHVQKLYYAGFDLTALCEDYAILIGNADIPYEIHLLRARASSDIPEILDAMQQRKDLLQQRKNTDYREESRTVTEQATAYTKERYVILLVTTDNAGAQKIIDRVL